MKVTDIVMKDLKIVLSDKKALGIMILMPIILTTILSFALVNTFIDGGNSDKVSVALVKKYDREMDVKRFRKVLTDGMIAQGLDAKDIEVMMNSTKELDVEEVFMDKFLNSVEIKRIMEYRIAQNEERAMELLKNKEVSAVVILPENFIYDMNINFFTPYRNKVNIKVLGDEDRHLRFQIVESIMKGFSEMASSMVISKNVLIETAMEEEVGYKAFEGIERVFDTMLEDAENMGINIDYVKLKGKEPVTSFKYYSVAMATMFVLFAASFGSKELLEEKDNMTYQRMIVAGTSKGMIVYGKFFATFLIALVQIFIMVLYSRLLLKVDWGNLFLVSLISLCTGFSVAGVGTLISVITFKVGNYKIANVFETAVIQTMALLGGSFFPVEILPSFMQKISFLSLNGLALKAYLKVMMGYGLMDITGYLFILLGIGITFTLIGIYFFNREGWDKDAEHNQTEAFKTA